MDILIVIITLALIAIVVLVVTAPLRSAPLPQDRGEASAETVAAAAAADEEILERDELEAAREAKYREIRDAELDYRTGKLSREDYDAVDGDLRAEAIEILNRLEGVADGGSLDVRPVASESSVADSSAGDAPSEGGTPDGDGEEQADAHR